MRRYKITSALGNSTPTNASNSPQNFSKRNLKGFKEPRISNTYDRTSDLERYAISDRAHRGGQRAVQFEYSSLKPQQCPAVNDELIMASAVEHRDKATAEEIEEDSPLYRKKLQQLNLLPRPSARTETSN